MEGGREGWEGDDVCGVWCQRTTHGGGRTRRRRNGEDGGKARARKTLTMGQWFGMGDVEGGDREGGYHKNGVSLNYVLEGPSQPLLHPSLPLDTLVLE